MLYSTFSSLFPNLSRASQRQSLAARREQVLICKIIVPNVSQAVINLPRPLASSDHKKAAQFKANGHSHRDNMSNQFFKIRDPLYAGSLANIQFFFN